MALILDKWTPPVLEKPDYFDTVKFVYKHLTFHISEDEAYTILNAFIEKWDANAGHLIKEEELVAHVVAQLQTNFDVMLPTKKIAEYKMNYAFYFFRRQHYIKVGL